MKFRSLILGLALCGGAGAYAAFTPPQAGLEAAVVAESYKLPITPPIDQGDSGLCWIHATLSMLETNYLAKHPDSAIRLSRAALQRASILDRFQRHVTGNSTQFVDGGVALDALQLIRQQGLVSADDGGDVVENSAAVYTAVSADIEGIEGSDGKLAALDGALKAHFAPWPGQTRLDGRALTPDKLAQTVLGDKVWKEYDVAPAGSPRSGPSTDPEARPETVVHYVEQPDVIRLIRASLKRGEAVVWGTSDHALMLFGADYAADGKPIAYWVKDTFAPYISRMDADKVHKDLTDITVSADLEESLTASR